MCFYSNHAQDNGRLHVHVCVCLCLCVLFVVVLCCFRGKKSEKWANMDNKNRLKEWSKEREKIQKKRKHWEHVKTTDSDIDTIWPSTDLPKRSSNCHFAQRIVSTLHLGFTDVLGQKSYPKRRKKRALFLTRGPNHALYL